ncbi:MAG: DNA gyrase subunit A [Spirochaetes bacterium]|nr:DNA gyrase subunit A [Spirochaetota bacterium]
MATKDNPEKPGKPEKVQLSTATADILKTVSPIAIEDEIKNSYLTYAMSVIVARALPDVRDGLKPVHRRILYAMYDTGMTHEKAYKKSATTVGEVLGKYHPHGDAAVFETMVRMAQDFSLRYPLIDGQGNFGSIDGDPAAAMRYTESRMTHLAEKLLDDIEKDTVLFVPNFDDSRKEPAVLPAAFPNLLVNGSSGIAIGMATNIPPHNLREVTNAISAYIDNPSIDIPELMKHVKGPDFPTGGIIYGSEGIKSAYLTGRGHISVRAKVDLETTKNGREVIVVTEIPYMVKKTDIVVKIAELVKEGKIEGVAGLRDESDRTGMRIVIELKKGVMTQIVLNQLFKHTPLETTFGIINLALDNGEPKVLTLKQMIELFVKHRVDVVTRRIKFQLKEAEDEAHILEGLLIAQENIDEVIKIIKTSSSTENARDRLMARFKLSERQAQAILDMPLKRLTSLEREKIIARLDELKKLIAHYKDLLASPRKILDLIKKEMIAITEKFGDDRRTEIAGKTETIEIETDDLIHDENMAVTITTQGFIKRVNADSYRVQSRGGVGVQSGNAKTEDYIRHMFVASTKDVVVFCTDKGKAFWMKVHEIPETAKTAQGKSIKFILNLAPTENITSYFTVREFKPETSILMITKHGVIKKMELAHLENSKKRGVVMINLSDGDELVGVDVIAPGEDFIITSKNGLALRTTEAKVRAMGRSAAGVRGMRLSDGDECISITTVSGDNALIVITENGLGKRLSSKRFNVKGRGTRGQIYMKLDERTGRVAAVKAGGEKDDLMVVTDEDMVIKMHISDIPELGRNAKGVRIVNIKPPVKVTDIAIDFERVPEQ